MHGQCRTFSNPVISDISRHLQTGRDSVLTACTLHLFIPSTVYFDSPNQFHVHTYISHWGSEEQSPSAAVNWPEHSRTPATPPNNQPIPGPSTRHFRWLQPQGTVSILAAVPDHFPLLLSRPASRSRELRYGSAQRVGRDMRQSL